VTSLTQADLDDGAVICLHERADVRVRHCGQPMRWARGSVSWTGKGDAPAAERVEHHKAWLACDVCESTLQLSFDEAGV
jgi:hypothetical protein